MDRTSYSRQVHTLNSSRLTSPNTVPRRRSSDADPAPTQAAHHGAPKYGLQSSRLGRPPASTLPPDGASDILMEAASDAASISLRAAKERRLLGLRSIMHSVQLELQFLEYQLDTTDQCASRQHAGGEEGGADGSQVDRDKLVLQVSGHFAHHACLAACAAELVAQLAAPEAAPGGGQSLLVAEPQPHRTPSTVCPPEAPPCAAAAAAAAASRAGAAGHAILQSDMLRGAATGDPSATSPPYEQFLSERKAQSATLRGTKRADRAGGSRVELASDELNTECRGGLVPLGASPKTKRARIGAALANDENTPTPGYVHKPAPNGAAGARTPLADVSNQTKPKVAHQTPSLTLGRSTPIGAPRRAGGDSPDNFISGWCFSALAGSLRPPGPRALQQERKSGVPLLTRTARRRVQGTSRRGTAPARHSLLSPRHRSSQAAGSPPCRRHPTAAARRTPLSPAQGPRSRPPLAPAGRRGVPRDSSAGQGELGRDADVCVMAEDAGTLLESDHDTSVVPVGVQEWVHVHGMQRLDQEDERRQAPERKAQV